jgi:hypothetical protein
MLKHGKTEISADLLVDISLSEALDKFKMFRKSDVTELHKLANPKKPATKKVKKEKENVESEIVD